MEGEPFVDMALDGLPYPPEHDGGEAFETPPIGETEASENAPPRSSSPSTAPAGDGYSSLYGGDIASGGVVLLVLGVLTMGLVLPRHNGRLSRLFCELPKPTLALLLPLERPG